MDSLIKMLESRQARQVKELADTERQLKDARTLLAHISKPAVQADIEDTHKGPRK